jgi:hypothetical protein
MAGGDRTQGGRSAQFPRLTTRRLMVLVAGVAIMLATLIPTARLVTDLSYWTFSHGWNTSVFPIGQPVMTCEDITLERATLPAGTRGIVVGDPPDEDSAYPYRPVEVKIAEGQYRGTTRSIARRSLRAR